MDELENLNNNDLRQYLLQCGFPNTPITDTTRKILIKRLRNHLNKKETQRKKQILSVTRFSSDEESDIDQNRQESEPYKRKTYNSNYVSSSGAPSFSQPKSSRNTQSSHYLNYKFSTPSTNSTTVFNNNLSTSNNTSYDKYKISPTSRIYVSPTFAYQERPEDVRYQSNNETYDCSDYSDVEYNTSSPCKINNNVQPQNSEDGLSYRSNFTKRLLNFRSKTLANKAQPKFQNSTEQNNYYGNLHNNSPQIGIGSNRRPYIRDKRNNIGETSYDHNNLSASTAFKNVISSLNKHYSVQQHFIPCTLLSTVVIFFVFLALLYINITPNLISTINEKNIKVNICKSKDEMNLNKFNALHTGSADLQQNSITCIYKNQVNDALEVIKLLVPILQEKAQEHYCKDQTKEFSLNSRYAINLLFDKITRNSESSDIRKLTHDLHNAEYLVENNPQWHISHVNANGDILTYDQVIKLRSNKENYYAILNPSLPMLCSINQKLQKLFFLIGTSALGLLIIGVIYIFYKKILNYRHEKQQTVFILIEEIKNNLITKAKRNPNEKSVVLNHLRDMLIPVIKRKEMEWAWNKAIAFLEHHESRVVFEMGIVNGEDCQMIKWIDTVSQNSNISSSENRKSYIIKKWESPAFIDKTNKIRNPPTKCLKIRQMFDKSESGDPNLTQVINDAILEKVGLNCKIYDIQIDKQSCCVYVRCATEMDAGIVHDEINGWWFDKRLVSIKFVRLERYLTRFPNSLAGPKCLYPSNSKKLSISQCSANLRDYHDDNDTDEEQA